MIGTSVYIFLVGKELFCTTASLFAVFCYLATSNTLEHGSSFRADPICAFLFLITLKLIFKKRANWISTLIAGIITALSLMISIKVIFYLGPICLALLLLFRLQEEKKSGLTRIFVFGISFAVFFAILYTTHRWGLLLPDDHNTIKILSRVSSKVILTDQVNPNLTYFLLSLQKNISIWSILLAGILVSLFDVMKGWREQRNNILLLSLLPLLFPLVFYRNTFPYFFVFIMAPLVLYCGAFLEKVVMGYTREGRRVYFIILNISVFAVALHLFLNYSAHNDDRTAAQKQLIYVIHKIFPNPVPYIDRCSMVSSFPKVGFFMSTWGVENYLDAGEPIMRGLLLKEKPIFLLGNTPLLNLSLPDERITALEDYKLLAEDRKILLENYIHHWGMLYVLGKKIRFESGTSYKQFEILVPGKYTIESDRPLDIDGTTIDSGDTLTLRQGIHHIRSDGKALVTYLRWGENLFRPQFEPIKEPLFYGF